jgi:hypothetical protein
MGISLDEISTLENVLNEQFLNVIETGVASEQDIIALARLYWKIVDDTSGQSDLDAVLESLYTTLHIHCSNLGFADVWDDLIP